MNRLLLLLFRRGAARASIRISTSEIGAALSMSQQNASRCLIELEKQGKIERSGKSIRLPPSTVREIASLYHELKKQFEHTGALEIRGKIVPGFKEGAYYLSLPGYQNAIKRALGFVPYPGTLNLALDKGNLQKRHLLKENDRVEIPGFQSGNRTFGAAYAYPCKIGKINGAILVPVRTHHSADILELIAPVSILKKLRKKDGDAIMVVV